MLVTFTMLLQCVLLKFCILFHPEIYLDLAHKAYTIYVRPKLEYNTVIWSPFLHQDINLVESVQKKFTRHICIRCKISFNSYSNHLSKLNINSLEYR